MFEQRRSGGWSFSWAGIVFVAVFVLVVFWVFRQNPPEPVEQVASKTSFTQAGEIVSGPLELEAKGLLTFPMNLNKRSMLDVTFFTGDSSKRLAFAVLKLEDLQKFTAGEEVAFVTNTGPVPRGVIKRVMEPGNYVLVFNNRMNAEPIHIAESNLTLY